MVPLSRRRARGGAVPACWPVACRHCQGIAYASQSDDVLGRAWRRQRKVEARLGENEQRPKGMHQTTHERLLSAIDNCEYVKDVYLMAAAAYLGLAFD